MMIAISQFLMMLGICLWTSSLIYSKLDKSDELEVEDESASENETIDLEV